MIIMYYYYLGFWALNTIILPFLVSFYTIIGLFYLTVYSTMICRSFGVFSLLPLVWVYRVSKMDNSSSLN